LIGATADPLPPDPTADWAGQGRLHMGRAMQALPATYEGLVDLNYDNAPPGAVLRAFIGNVGCGEAVIYEEDGESRFSLEVRSELQQAGCGAPGSEVSIQLLNAPIPSGNVVDRLHQDWTGRLTAGLDLQFLQRRDENIAYYQLNDPWTIVPNLRETQTVEEWLDDTVRERYDGPLALYHYDEGSAPGSEWQRRIEDPDDPLPGYVNNLTLVGEYEPYWVRIDPLLESPFWPVQPLIKEPELDFVEGWNHMVWRAGTTQINAVLPFWLGDYGEVWRFNPATGQWERHLANGTDAENAFQAFLEFETYWLFVPAAPPE
jgi:hypothetical protein